jgi:glycosyltransferase involved in cell wall biosynthesis
LQLFGSAPVVLSTIHNIYEGGWQRRLAYRITDRFSIHTTAVSAAVARHYVEMRAVPQSKCSVVTNGIDLAEFDSVLDRRTGLRNQLNAGYNFIWLAAGRVVPAKDYPNLLSAFDRVHSAKPHSQLWIAGEAQGPEAKKIRDLAERLGITESVRWLGLRDDMPALLDAADAFVLSSAWEGMPLAVVEAMAMQRPIVATDVGGVRELVGEAGLLLARKDSVALADAMFGVMRMPESDRQAMGHAARERIRERFDINAKVDEWEALYSRLLRDRR